MKDMEKDAKLAVLQKLKERASEAMKGGLGGLKKVSVAAPTEKGLKEGLDLAKETVDGEDEGEHLLEHKIPKPDGGGKVDEILAELSDEECDELLEKLQAKMAEREEDDSEDESEEEAEEMPSPKAKSNPFAGF
jgi:hypothetical protein